MAFKYPQHVRFKCEECALCCADTKTRNRRILVMRLEAERISKKILKPSSEFCSETAVSEPYVFQMKKTSEGKCVFLERKRCKIYGLRPLVCRFYPFELREHVGEGYVFSFTEECPCIGKGPVLRKDCFERLFRESEDLVRRNSSRSG